MTQFPKIKKTDMNEMQIYTLNISAQGSPVKRV